MRRSILLAAAGLGACEDPTVESSTLATVRMEFSRGDGFFTAPFPSDDLLRNGAVDLGRWPNPARQRDVQGLIDLAGQSRGFAT